LDIYQIRIAGALANEVILEALEGKGYDRVMVQDLKAQIGRVQSHHRGQGKQRAALMFGTSEFNRLWSEADDVYKECLFVARRAHLFSGFQSLLELGGARAEVFRQWFTQARDFFQQAMANPDICEMLVLRRLAKSRLELGLQLVERVQVYRSTRLTGLGISRLATKIRDDEIATLDEDMAIFADRCRRALRGQPEMLGIMGMRPLGRPRSV